MSLVIHQVPGRVRLKSRFFKSDPTPLRELEARLGGCESITELRVNEQTGSLLLFYRGESMPAALTDAIDELNDRLADRPSLPSPEIRREQRLPSLARYAGMVLLKMAVRQAGQRLVTRALRGF